MTAAAYDQKRVASITEMIGTAAHHTAVHPLGPGSLRGGSREGLASLASNS